jgi:hypothetical protein
MAIRDITEDFNYDLSIPATATQTYELNSQAYDIAFNEQPFIMGPTTELPYRRETAPYRREQIDQSTEPGEQSFTGWWFRSQSSFHLGAGARFFEPAQDANLRYRFNDSEGVDVWNKGEISLLKDVVALHETTASNQKVRSIKYGDTDAVLMLDGHDVDKITANGTVVHFIDYNTGADDPVYAICDDGTTAYWATNDINAGTNKAHLYRKALTADSTVADTLMFNINSYLFTAGKVVMDWVKGRIILCADNKVYELTPTSSSLPSPIYTHPNTSYTFTSIAESGAALYVAGYAGTQSSIYKFVLSSAGAITSLSSGVVAAEMPSGELIYSMKQYLGYMMIGTSKGIRAATISPDDGSLAYGPLIAETEQPVYDFAFRDRFCWATAKVNGKAGLIRIDLSEQISPLRFAYAHDLFKNVAKECTGVAFIGTTERKAFTVPVDYIYLESPTNLVANGYLQTGFIRYATLESKYFKFIKLRGNLQNGTITVGSVNYLNNTDTLLDFTAEIVDTDIGIARPTGGQEFLAFKFTLNRSNSNNTSGAIMTGYQIKALPAVERQKLIQYPLYCFDIEMDKFGNTIGYDGRAYSRILSLEELEKGANVITIKDFRTSETFQGLIEDVKFSSSAAPDARFNGFGGILLITVRKF